MAKNNGSVIHTNILRPSRVDEIELCVAVEERFLTLCRFHLQVRGIALVPPPELNKDMLLWRQMRVRHKKRDYRNTRDETLSTRRVADWTLKVNCQLRNQEYKPIDWAN